LRVKRYGPFSTIAVIGLLVSARVPNQRIVVIVQNASTKPTENTAAAGTDLGTNRTSSTVARQKEALTAPVGASHTTPASPPSPGGRRRRHRPRSGRSPAAPRASWARRRAHTWLRSPAAAPGGRRRW